MSTKTHKPVVLLVGAEPAGRLALAQALGPVADLRPCSLPAERLAEECLALGAHVALVTADPLAGLEATFAQVATLAAAGARVVVVGPAKDPDLILGALRAGAREFVVGSDAGELRRIVAALTSTAPPPGGLGNLITVFATRGGVGATTLAVNLAGALARRQPRVCLLDVDLHLGDVLSFLDLPAGYSITDVIDNMTRLDRDLLDASVIRHASGVRVLAQSGKLEEAERVRATGVRPLLDFLRNHYSQVVIDGLTGFDELSLSILDASQQIVLVLTQDVPAVRSTRRCVDLFRQLGYDGKIKLVVNRHQASSKITPDVIAAAVGLHVAHTVSNDFATAIDAINRGLMLHDVAARSPLTRDIEALPAALSGQREAADSKRSFLQNLLSRKGNDGTNRAA
jgi:pilus assembly protein CpaE